MPTLKFAVERDTSVAVQLCCLGCYEAIAKKLDNKSHVATAILPAVTPILMNTQLNAKQYEMVASKVQVQCQFDILQQFVNMSF
jgi:hypothetical protein